MAWAQESQAFVSWRHPVHTGVHCAKKETEVCGVAQHNEDVCDEMVTTVPRAGPREAKYVAIKLKSM